MRNIKFKEFLQKFRHNGRFVLSSNKVMQVGTSSLMLRNWTQYSRSAMHPQQRQVSDSEASGNKTQTQMLELPGFRYWCYGQASDPEAAGNKLQTQF